MRAAVFPRDSRCFPGCPAGGIQFSFPFFFGFFIFLRLLYFSLAFLGSSCAPKPCPTAFAVSQNHRMVGVGRDLCGSSSPTLLSVCGVILC